MKRSPIKRTVPLSTKGTLRRTPLRFRSAKRARDYRIRRQLARDLMADGPVVCEWPGCGAWADDWHEKLARSAGGSITDAHNRVCLCRSHHDALTFNPDVRAEAVALGFVIERRGGAA